MTKTSSNMLVKNYKLTWHILYLNQRMKYENEWSVQETCKTWKLNVWITKTYVNN